MRTTSALALTGALLFTAACTTTDPFTGQPQLTRTASGAGLGALAGAGIGLLAGGDDRRNALIGAGVGALAGGAIGNYMDQQQAELRAQLQGTGVSVTRVGNNIILNMPSNITFATDQSQVIPAFFPTLDSVALVLNRFNQTLVNISGFTDSTGSATYNLGLSDQRATSVANYLTGRGVNPQRFLVNGKGEANPVATNDTPAGRALNRRVQIKLIPLS